MTPRTHRLKTVQPHFDAFRSGRKTVEIRLNDRDFRVGDLLELCEYDLVSDRFTGECEIRVVTYVVEGFEGSIKGWVMLCLGAVEGDRLS
jgi:hypothetical protein